MPRHDYRSLSTVMGSWPFQASAKVGPYGPPAGTYELVPTTLNSRATILGTVRDSSAKFDVGGESFWLWIDTAGSPYTPTAREISFLAGGPYTLDEVVARINSVSGEASDVAFNDNGFLRLESPRTGEHSYLLIQTHTSHGSGTSNADVLRELGLFAETESFGGDLAQSLHIDPDRQVAMPNQSAMGFGESFDANIFNRIAFQLAVNSDRTNNLIAKRRLAIKKEVEVTYLGTEGDPRGIDLTGEYMFTGPDTFTNPPTKVELDNIVQVLDENGNEIVKERQQQLQSTSTAGSTEIWRSEEGELRVSDTSSMWNVADSDPDNEVYVVLSDIDGTLLDPFEGIPLKIIKKHALLDCSLLGVDPNTGERMEDIIKDNALGTVNCTSMKVQITKERVRITGIYDGQGGSRVEFQEVAKYPLTVEPTTVTKVELNNRVVVAGADFQTKSVAEGDLLEWSGSGETDPYSNDGIYRVGRIIDEETLELVSQSFDPVYLNPVEGTGFGDIEVRTDGFFWKDPFLQFDQDPASNYVAPDSGILKVLFMGMTSFKEAADNDPSFLAGPNVRYLQEASKDVQAAIMNTWGPSVTDFTEILYPSEELASMTLEHQDYRYKAEHFGGNGRHSDIHPDSLWVGELTDSGYTYGYFNVDKTAGTTIKTTATPASIHMVGYTGPFATEGTRLLFGKSRGSFVDTETETVNNDELLHIIARGVDADDSWNYASSIYFEQDAASVSGYVPGRITFSTSDAASTLTERMRIDKDGRVGIASNNPQYGRLELDPGSTLDENWGITLWAETAKPSSLTARSYLIPDTGVGTNWIMARGSSSTAGITITESGLVGIGVNDPDVSLHVVGDGGIFERSSRQLVLDPNASGGNVYAALYTELTTGLRIQMGARQQSTLILDTSGYVGINTVPDEAFHILGSNQIFWMEDVSSGNSSVTNDAPGIQLSAGAMTTTNKYTPALKFMSTDGDLAAGDPKLLAYVVGRATEDYDGTTKGGMALDIATSPNTPGAGSVPTVRLTIHQDGAISTNDEQSPDVDGGGLCLKHGSVSGNILTAKNYDAGGALHDMSARAEVDTYLEIQKLLDADGGVDIAGFSGSYVGMWLNGYATVEDTTELNGNAATVIRSAVDNGSNNIKALTLGKLLSVMNYTSTKFSIMHDGTVHAAGGANFAGSSDITSAAASGPILNVHSSNAAYSGSVVTISADRDESSSYALLNCSADLDGTPTTSMACWGDGRMTVGSFSPWAQLDITKTVTGSAVVQAYNTLAEHAYILLRTNNSADYDAYLAIQSFVNTFSIGVDSGSSDFRICDANGVSNSATMRFRIDSSGRLSTGGEVDPDVVPGGMCLQQNSSNSPNAITLKALGFISHPFTSVEQNDTYCTIGIYDTDRGGASIRGYNDDGGTAGIYSPGLRLMGLSHVNRVDATSALTSRGVVEVDVTKNNGTTYDFLGINDNAFVIRNNESTRLIVKGDGDIESATGGIYDTFDTEDDAVACRDLAYVVAGELDKVMQYHAPKLEEMGVMKNGFMSTNKFRALTLGAIGEVFEVVNYLCKQMGVDYKEIKDRIRGNL